MKKKNIKKKMKKNTKKNSKNRNIENLNQYLKKKKIHYNGLNRDSGQTLKKENTDPKEKFVKEIKINQELNEERKGKIIELLEKYENICMYDDKKLTTIRVAKHGIELKEGTKLKPQRAYRESEETRKIIKDEVNKMLKDGVIRKLKSSYSSPVVIVGKKDGSKRFCVDFRKLNKETKIDGYPLPKMDDLLERFRESDRKSVV